MLFLIVLFDLLKSKIKITKDQNFSKEIQIDNRKVFLQSLNLSVLTSNALAEGTSIEYIWSHHIFKDFMLEKVQINCCARDAKVNWIQFVDLSNFAMANHVSKRNYNWIPWNFTQFSLDCNLKSANIQWRSWRFHKETSLII